MNIDKDGNTKITIEVTVRVETCVGCGSTCTRIPDRIEVDLEFVSGRTAAPSSYTVNGGCLPPGWTTIEAHWRDDHMHGIGNTRLFCPRCSLAIERVLDNAVAALKAGITS